MLRRAVTDPAAITGRSRIIKDCDEVSGEKINFVNYKQKAKTAAKAEGLGLSLIHI